MDTHNAPIVFSTFLALQSAAETGDLDAQYQLALAYTYGVGTDQVLAQALKWNSKAAEQGYDLEYQLAFAYASCIQAEYESTKPLLNHPAWKGPDGRPANIPEDCSDLVRAASLLSWPGPNKGCPVDFCYLPVFVSLASGHPITPPSLHLAAAEVGPNPFFGRSPQDPIYAPDGSGNTPLHFAAAHDHEDFVTAWMAVYPWHSGTGEWKNSAEQSPADLLGDRRDSFYAKLKQIEIGVPTVPQHEGAFEVTE